MGRAINCMDVCLDTSHMHKLKPLVWKISLCSKMQLLLQTSLDEAQLALGKTPQ